MFMQPLDASSLGDLRREDVQDQRNRCEFWERTAVACLSSDNEVLRLARHGSDVPQCERNGQQMFLLAGGATSSVIVKGATVSGSGGDLGLIRARVRLHHPGAGKKTGKRNISSSASPACGGPRTGVITRVAYSRSNRQR